MVLGLLFIVHEMLMEHILSFLDMDWLSVSFGVEGLEALFVGFTGY